MAEKLQFQEGRTVKVYGINKFSENALTIHFQKSQNGGGDVRQVYLPSSRPDYALIEFESDKIADSLLRHETNVKKSKEPLRLERCSKLDKDFPAKKMASSESSAICLNCCEQYGANPTKTRNNVVTATLCEVSNSDGTNKILKHSGEEFQAGKELKDSFRVESRVMQYIFTYHWNEFEKLKNVCKEVRFETKEKGGEIMHVLSNDNVKEKHFRKTKDAFLEFYQRLYPGMDQKDFQVQATTVEKVQGNSRLHDSISEARKMFSVIVSENANTCVVYGKQSSVKQAVQFLENELKSPRIDSTDETKQEQRSLLSYRASEKIQILVYQGDITKEHADAIVNPANQHLKHRAGAAKQIVEQGGKCIQEESDQIMAGRTEALHPGDVEITTQGRLPCKFIIHAVGPSWNETGDENQCRKLLRKACLNSLNLARQNHATSIAIPAISSGVFGVPIAICAEVLLTAAQDYSNGGKPGTLQEIRFVNIDERTVEVFKSEMKKRFHPCTEKQERCLPLRKNRPEVAIVPGNPDASTNQLNGFEDSFVDKTKAGTLLNLSDGKKRPSKDIKEGTTQCCICLEGIKDPKVLSKCKHTFCKVCIDKAFHEKKICPVCSTVYGETMGNQPNGTMKITKQSQRLPGYGKVGSIVIHYSFSSGAQGANHPNPGQSYVGTSRTAYLPDNAEGNKVLGLLRRAFDQRLTFTIGTSVTSGHSNQVTWNDIHHKTSPTGGPTNFGYPDPDYLKRVQDELAAKGIK